MNKFGVALGLILITSGLVVGGCAHRAQEKSLQLSWSGQMDQFAKVITEIYPLVASKRDFNNPENFEAIESGVDKLSQVVHEVAKMTPSKMKRDEKGDPSLPYIAAGFSGEIMRAQLALRDGKRDYARSVLRSVTQYCIQCHTRSQRGPHFTSSRDQSQKLPKNPLERADLLQAIRKYDQSLKIYELILEDQKIVKENSFMWEKAVRSSLNLAVRVKQDPDLALNLVNTVIGTNQAPRFLLNDAEVWRQSLLKWKREKGRNQQGLKKAKKLMKRANMLKVFSEDQNGYIYYLRASNLLHSHLRSATDSREVSQVLYLLGQCYDSIDRGGQWRLSDLFYESCIRQSPYTDLARKCYDKYESNKYFGFGGSSGLSVPNSLMDHLDELKNKIGPKEKH